MTLPRLARLLLLLVASLTLALSGCSGSGDGGGSDLTPEQALGQAKETLDQTSGVQFDLVASNLPGDVTGVLSGTGVGTHAPAFEGSFKIQVFGASVDVPVVAVGGKVYAVKPLSSGYSQIDPTDYGAPDPAALFSAAHGISGFLTATTGLTQGETVRGGTDNKEVLTSYAGTVPASVVSRLIPSARGDDFDASYTLTAAGELREATLTGEFYPGARDVTYTITLSNYGTTKDITAP